MDWLRPGHGITIRPFLALCTLLLASCGNVRQLPPQAARLPEPAARVEAAESTPAATTGRHLLYVLDPRGGATETQILVVDPDAQRIVHTIPAGYDPQIAVAPDGRHLYLTDTRFPPGQFQHGSDMLSIIETGTWRLLQEIESPNRIKHKIYGRDAMVFSHDGSQLYIHKRRILEGAGRFHGARGYSAPRTDHWWDIFDVRRGEFLPDPPHVPDCGIAQAMPAPDGRTLAILCFQRNEVVFVDLGTNETIGSRLVQGDIRDLAIPGEVAGAARSPDGRLIYVATTEGQLQVIDAGRRMVERRVDLRMDASLRVHYGSLALAPDGSRLYAGVEEVTPFDGEYRQEVWVFDTQNWQRVATYRDRNVGMAFSPDGKRLYAVSPHDKDFTILDTSDGREIGTIRDLGETPSVIVVAPAPPE